MTYLWGPLMLATFHRGDDAFIAALLDERSGLCILPPRTFYLNNPIVILTSKTLLGGGYKIYTVADCGIEITPNRDVSIDGIHLHYLGKYQKSIGVRLSDTLSRQ